MASEWFKGRVSKTSIVAILIVIAIIGALYAFGTYIGRPCATVAGCTGCWDALNDSEKNNVYIDMISCACGKARLNDYADSATNMAIENRYNILSGETSTAENICSGEVPMIRYQ